MQRTFQSNLSRLLGYLRPYWLTLSAAILCTVLVTGAKLYQARFIGKIFTLMGGDRNVIAGNAEVMLQTHQGREAAIQSLYSICIAFLVMMAVMGGATYLMRYLVNLTGQMAMRDMRNQTFAHVQKLPLAFFDKMRLGEIQSRASGDVVAATGIFTQLADFFVNLGIVVFAVTYMVTQNASMTFSVLCLSPIIGVAIAQFGKRIGRLTEAIQARGADLSAIIYEGISSVKGIKAYNLEAVQVKRFQHHSEECYRVNMKQQSIAASQSPVVDFLGAVGIVMLVGLGAYRILQGQSTLGQMAEYWSLLVMTTQPINALSGFYSNFQSAAAAAGRAGSAPSP